MAVEIKVPEVGESITEVMIAQWIKRDGEYVEKNDALVELETDKVNQELTAPESGVVKVTVAEGETVDVGTVIGSIEPGEAPTASAPAKKEKSPPSPAPEKKEAKPAEVPASAEAVETPRASSVARKMAADYGVDIDNVAGTGSHGRVTKEDILAHVEDKKRGEKQPAAPEPPAPVRTTVPAANTREGSAGREVTRERMSMLRKRIAVRLVEAQQTAAILTTFNEIDMTAVIEARKKYKDIFKERHGASLGFMSFFIKAAVDALRMYPRINASIENEEVVYHHYQDIGVAVGTDRGLVVPVIRNAESLSFSGVEKAIRGLAEKARTGGLTLDDLSGGTFTISNGGVYGSMMSTPILNPPQSGILGMHNITERPMVVDGEIQIRPMMYIALSYDHRMVDGKEAVSFLVRIKECIENPERMLLEV